MRGKNSDTIHADPSSHLTARIRGGAYTYLLQTSGLTDDAQQTNTQVAGQLFLSAPFAGTPAFTVADRWAAALGTLSNGQLTGGAKTAFPAAYTSAGTWVGRPGADLMLHVDLGVTLAGSSEFDVPIHRAIVTFDHTSPSKATNGTIAGVIFTEVLVLGLSKTRRNLVREFCSATTSFDGTAEWIRQAADILIDGTNTPGVPCDAISIGIGFEADEVANVSSVLPDPAVDPHPCAADAGVDHAVQD